MTIRFLIANLTAYKGKEFIRRLLCICFAIALAIPASAQGLRFGMKVGVPMTEYFEPISPAYSAATRRYTLGPSVEMHLWKGFGLELDVLYKRMGYVGTVGFGRTPLGGGVGTENFDVKGNSWDFPLMVKYRFGRVVRPYVTGGGVMRYIGPVRAQGVREGVRLVSVEGRPVTTAFTEPIDTSDPFDLRKRIWPGLTFAAGIEFGGGRLRLLPEFRYTRWTSNINERFGTLGRFRTLRFNPNQAEFLLGFLF